MYGITFDIKHQELSSSDRETLLDRIKYICLHHGLIKDNEYTYMLFRTQDPLAKIYSTIKDLTKDDFIKGYISRLVVLNIADYSDFTEYLTEK